jgi:nitroimidazol reductase NimA-like FMN-containing flavoprotein (pyridoxamine 5'-phosphate oxidase superfamily)
MSLKMDRTEREAFLADVHVGMIAIEEPGRGPLLAPIWYGYEPGGEIWIVTERDSRKGRLLAQVERFSLCAQTEAPPYKYVSIEGPITAVEDADVERDERPLAHRYLGPEMGDQYIAATGGADAREDNIRIRMKPDRWLTADYEKELPQLADA